MKKNIWIVVFLSNLACQTSSQKSSETSAPSEELNYVSYGEQISSEDSKSIITLKELMKDNDSLNVKLTSEIEKTCKMKGCWMTMKIGESNPMRVTFKDYGFFVPKEGMEGKIAVIDGVVKKSTTSVEMLRHFAQDEGQTADEIAQITEPKEEYTFVADGVLIEGE